MRGIDRILLGIVFAAVFWRLADQTLFRSDAPVLRKPLIVSEAIEVQPRSLQTSLADSRIQPSSPKPNSFYTGSAFALSRDGHWATATHVTQGCQRVDLLIETGTGKFRRQPIEGWRALKGKDVSVMDSPEGARGLTLADTLMNKGELGFFFGYPKGKASAGYAVHLGRSRMIRFSGRQTETSDEWAIYELLPGKKIALGGNSGGPMMNELGEVVGVISAGSDRRGRVNTSIVPALSPLKAFSKPEHVRRDTLTPDNYVAYGRWLRSTGLVTKVDCRT